MSYLEMASATLPDMNKGIVSLWFRDIRKGGPPPPATTWPSGLWHPGTDSMVPPDTVGMLKNDPTYAHNVFYWDAYGMPISALGIGLGLLGPATVCMPNPPPFITDDMHMMLTFGNPHQSYDYCQWQLQSPGVIDAVHYLPQVIGAQWIVPDWPPPYAPYFVNQGKFKPLTLVLGSPVSRPDYVPQSFIGVDKNGYLTICLQTNTKADYKGWAFQLDKMTEITATQSYLDDPDLETAGTWIRVPGYWDGYEFEYTDVSNEVMGAGPEFFVIGGGPAAFEFQTIPPVSDGSWHHLLFSFDISGEANLVRPSRPVGTTGGPLPPPIMSTTCQAWLALDDVNYTGTPLQHRFPMHDGFNLPLLPGMGTDIVGFGPVTSSVRANMNLKPNDIMPRNCWIVPMRGNPKDDLVRYVSTAGVWDKESTAYIKKGDYNFFVWTANIWTLYGPGSGQEWQGSLTPPKPSKPDPKTTFDPPTYFCDGFNLPVHGHPIGIPASTHHRDHNTGIEMAELQIWAGRTLDTSVVANRRLFIDFENKESGTGPKVPVSPGVAARMLGEPDILLHGNSNWQKGKNTGSTGVTAGGERILAGQFQPVAGIEKFKPEPALGK
jgi:hypothetical protein